MKSNKKVIMCVLFFIVTLVGCSKEVNLQDLDKPNEGDDYITFTVTGYNNGVDTSSGMTSQVWFYDISTEELKRIFDFKTTAQYSLGFYDRRNERIYYTERIRDKSADGYGDQIIMCDLATKEETQLTTDFFAVNDIIPLNNRLYFTAAIQGDGIERLGYIDLLSGEIIFWEKDGDIFIENVIIDTETESVFFTGYSIKERAYNVIHQGNGDFKIPTHTVYRTDLDFLSTEALYSDDHWLRAIMINGSKISILSDEKYNHPEIPTTLVLYDLNTKQISRVVWDSYRLEQKDPNYADEGNSIYGIMTTENGCRGIGKYNVDDGNMEMCIKMEPGNFINNMYLVHYID